jgi:hypothetical protein
MPRDSRLEIPLEKDDSAGNGSKPPVRFDLGSLRTSASVNSFMARKAYSDQVVHGIVSEGTSKTEMMNLQFSRSATILTSPAIPN